MVKNRTGVYSKDRTCAVCRETFDTERGLLLHQSNKIRVACYRAGLKKKIFKVKKVRENHFMKAKNRLIPKNHASVAATRVRGQTISADSKQIYLNVYEFFRGQGMGINEVNNHGIICVTENLDSFVHKSHHSLD